MRQQRCGFTSASWYSQCHGAAAQLIIIGVSPIAYSTWQTFVFLSIMFHHSNVELPIGLERALHRLIVTPRMHGIHHSIVREENKLKLVKRPDYLGPPARNTFASTCLKTRSRLEFPHTVSPRTLSY